ncbi:MAG: peptidylprolyl isomerase [Candidatus Woesearchaeota archaeon]
MEVKKGDFVEIEYSGRLKNDNKLFDTTDESLAKQESIRTEGIEYGPIIICVGEKNIIEFLDKEIEGKEIGKGYEKEFNHEEAFGKKDAKLIRVVSMTMFKKQNMNPYPGLQINAEGHFGVVRSVTGGRVIVDFNHPLAGRDLIYDFKVIGKVDDVKKQVECVAKFNLLPNKNLYSLDVEEDVLKINTKIDLPEQFRKNFEEKTKKLVPQIKKIEFSVEKKSEKKITTKE